MFTIYEIVCGYVMKHTYIGYKKREARKDFKYHKQIAKKYGRLWIYAPELRGY